VLLSCRVYRLRRRLGAALSLGPRRGRIEGG
jgi:hypothetical protein